MSRLPAILLALSAGTGCVITSGPDCTDACEKVLACEELDRNFRLACSSVGTNCFEIVAECAECIDTHSCEELVQGACDKRPDGSELCLIENP